MRTAAATAQAVMMPTSANVSWNARSGWPLSTRRRHSSTLPTRLMPAAPPSWRRKLIVLEWRLQERHAEPVRAFHETFVLIGLITAAAVVAALRMKPNRAAAAEAPPARAA